MNDHSAGTIREIARQIAAKFRPDRIVLFGSYAHGDATEDSDVDLLVVMQTQEKPLRAAVQIAAAVPHPLPLDILVMLPQQVADGLSRKALFITEVMETGQTLYEA